MKADPCREHRALLGAYALGGLSAEERNGIEAHLEGCTACAAELSSLRSVAELLPLADPAGFESAPAPSASLGDRIAASVTAERGQRQRRRWRIGLLASGATAAAVAALLAIFVLTPETGNPEQHVSFASLPAGVRIGATLEPHAYGTEIHMYVHGIASGTLCTVALVGPNGASYPAGTFRYRWGEDSDAVLSSALDLSRTRAISVRAGGKTFIAPLGRAPAQASTQHEEEST